uniref:Uncharacterized protein n=1 Tax=Panagrolaimus sp. JU765 TaxID=591449 RepID=A0AC34QNS1_9BILA
MTTSTTFNTRMLYKNRSAASVISYSSRQIPFWEYRRNQFSWLCGLVTPKVFYVSIHILTITFAALIGMACGGRISGTCPVPVMQAFVAISDPTLTGKNFETMLHHFSSLKVLIFSWFSILSSIISLFGFQQAIQLARFGRFHHDGRVRIKIHPMFYVIPTIVCYIICAILIMFWTYYVLQDQLQPHLSQSSIKRSVDVPKFIFYTLQPHLSQSSIKRSVDVPKFIFYTVCPLITTWSLVFYIIYGLVRTILYINVLCVHWNDAADSPTVQPMFRHRSIESRCSHGSKRSVKSHSNHNISTLEEGEAKLLDVSIEEKFGTWKSQKLEAIIEEREVE